MSTSSLLIKLFVQEDDFFKKGAIYCQWIFSLISAPLAIGDNYRYPPNTGSKAKYKYEDTI